MITREKAIEIMKYPHIHEHLRYTFPIVNAFEVKGGVINMRSWDAIIDYINGGVVDRGEQMTFQCGPSVIEHDFSFTLTLNLNKTTKDNDRILTKISLNNNRTDWIKSKNYYWQQAEDVAVVYYVASHIVYEQAEDLLTRGRHVMKLTRGLEKDIMQSLVIAGLE